MRSVADGGNGLCSNEHRNREQGAIIHTELNTLFQSRNLGTSFFSVALHLIMRSLKSDGADKIDVVITGYSDSLALIPR